VFDAPWVVTLVWVVVGILAVVALGAPGQLVAAVIAMLIGLVCARGQQHD
jgi:hypothetical protein